MKGNVTKRIEGGSNRNMFANALRGQLLGASVSADDVSPVEHELDVKVSSKNIIPFPYRGALTSGGITYTVNEDYSITVKSNGVWDKTYSTFGLIGNPGATNSFAPYLEDRKKHTFSAEVVENNGEILPNVAYTGNVSAGGVFSKILGTTERTSLTFSVNKSTATYDSIIIHLDSSMTGLVIDCTIKVQLEKGDTATPITPPSMNVEGVNVTVTDGENSQTVTADADGNVTGLMSLSPNMTLTTDNVGAVIECEYNRDANKVITDLEQQLNTLIATIGGD